MKIYSSEISGSLRIKGDITAENYITRTTVTSFTQSFSSGSTIFGDSGDDTHQFTGSLFIRGSRIHFDDGKTNLHIGNSAGSSNTTGTKSVFLGHHAGKANTTGEYNVAIGYLALDANQAGQRNIAIGAGSLGVLNTSGERNNIGIGFDAGAAIQGGTQKVSVGNKSYDQNEEGIKNTTI